MVQPILKPGRRESNLTPHPAPLIRKADSLMRRTILLVASMALTLLMASGVALAATIHCPNDPSQGAPSTELYCYGTSLADTMFGSDLTDAMFGKGGAD